MAASASFGVAVELVRTEASRQHNKTLQTLRHLFVRTKTSKHVRVHSGRSDIGEDGGGGLCVCACVYA